MDTKPFFDSIYDKLILRDLVGKLAPGTVLIFSVVISLYSSKDLNQFLGSIHLILLIVGAGVVWLMGFVLQFVGERLPFLKTHPKGFLKTHPGGAKSSRKDFFTSWSEFQKTASAYEKIHAERLNIIKEAGGNGAVALIIGSVFVGTGHWIRGIFQVFPLVILLILAILASIAL